MPAPLQAAGTASDLLPVATRGQEGAVRPLASVCIAMVRQREIRVRSVLTLLGELGRELSDGIRNGWVLVLKDVGFRGT